MAESWACLALECLPPRTWEKCFICPTFTKMYFFFKFSVSPSPGLPSSLHSTKKHSLWQLQPRQWRAGIHRDVAMAMGSLASVSMERGPGSVTGCSAVNNDLVVCVLHRNAVTSGNIPPRARGIEREKRQNLQKPDQFVSGVRCGANSVCHLY